MSAIRYAALLMFVLAVVSGGAYGLEPPPPPDTPPPTHLLANYPITPRVPMDSAPGGTIDLLKYLPDGAQVQISGKAVSAVIRDGESSFYVEETDRSAGMKATQDSVTVEPADLGKIAVTISGELATVDGERVLRASEVVLSSTAAPVDPLLMSLPGASRESC